MNLTPKQEAFCLAYMETGSPSEAYRKAYDASGMGSNALSVAASKLLKNPKITLRLAELRKPAVQKAQITLERHLADLEALRDRAMQAEKYGPAIQAEIARGKASGLYIDKTDITSNGETINGGNLVVPGVMNEEQWEAVAKANGAAP